VEHRPPRPPGRSRSPTNRPGSACRPSNSLRKAKPGAGPDRGLAPFQLTTTLDFNQTLEPGDGTEPNAPALVKNLHFDLPPGLIGNPQATPQCSNVDFSTLLGQGTNLCPGDTAVGAAVVTINEPADTGYISVTVPLFNLAPRPASPRASASRR